MRLIVLLFMQLSVLKDDPLFLDVSSREQKVNRFIFFSLVKSLLAGRSAVLGSVLTRRLSNSV